MTALAVDIDAPDVPLPELVILEQCDECHVAPGQQCQTWWGPMRSAWHSTRVEAIRAKLPAP